MASILNELDYEAGRLYELDDEDSKTVAKAMRDMLAFLVNSPDFSHKWQQFANDFESEEYSLRELTEKYGLKIPESIIERSELKKVS